MYKKNNSSQIITGRNFYMKKLILGFSVFLTSILLVGCTLSNTPTKKVERYLDNYRNLDETVLTQLDTIVEADTIMTATQKEDYRNILKRQYQNLVYTVKDEIVDGDKAKVTVEIEVYDLYKITNEADKYYTTSPDEFKDETGNVSQTKYIDYRISKLKEAKDKVKYTIEFNLTKVDNVWIIDDINEETRQKIHGLYAY